MAMVGTANFKIFFSVIGFSYAFLFSICLSSDHLVFSSCIRYHRPYSNCTIKTIVQKITWKIFYTKNKEGSRSLWTKKAGCSP